MPVHLVPQRLVGSRAEGAYLHCDNVVALASLQDEDTEVLHELEWLRHGCIRNSLDELT